VRILYLDCFSGASGDMVLGALIDAGVPLEDLRRALGSLALDPSGIWTERVVRAGVSATKFCVRGEDPEPASAHDHRHLHRDEHGHSHGQSHSHSDSHSDSHSHSHELPRAQDDGRVHDPVHPRADPHAHTPGPAHRTLPEIYRLIDGSSLSAAGKDRAKGLFARLGEAEGAIHGTSLDKVHLHEVGALDSIIDVVGTVYAMEHLGADEVVASPLNVGSGTVRAAHGLYPVPAPATLHLLGGTPIYAGAQRVELVTPTGALLVTAFARRFGPVPPMRLRAVGYGAGARDLPDTPNVLRVLVGDADASGTAETAGDARGDTVVVIECEIDDMNPQIFGRLMDQLLTAGALDVYYTPVQMKKNRPGTLLTVLAAPATRQLLVDLVFRETTTIGVRYRESARECLARSEQLVETPLGPVRFKVASRAGAPLNVSAAFDDLARLADQHGRPVKDIQALAMKAYWDLAAPQS